MLANEVDQSNPMRSHLLRLMTESERAAAIVQDLLTMARRGVSGRKVFNLNKIIADCRKSPEVERLFSYHPAVQLKTDLAPDLLNISGSSVHVAKTLFNLLSNACEAMPRAGDCKLRRAINIWISRFTDMMKSAREIMWFCPFPIREKESPPPT